MPDMTLAQALEVFENLNIPDEYAAGGSLGLVAAFEDAGKALAAEIRRRDGDTCDNCAHQMADSGEMCCGLTLTIRTVDVDGWNEDYNEYTPCVTFGNGCRAWQKREGE